MADRVGEYVRWAPCPTLTHGEHHYEVLSGEVCTFGGCFYGDMPEPPEYGRCYAVVTARTKSEARRKACATRDFEPWVSERRGDGRVPFGGLIVTEMGVCQHGWCFGCHPEEYCDDCLTEIDFSEGLLVLMHGFDPADTGRHNEVSS